MSANNDSPQLCRYCLDRICPNRPLCNQVMKNCMTTTTEDGEPTTYQNASIKKCRRCPECAEKSYRDDQRSMQCQIEGYEKEALDEKLEKAKAEGAKEERERVLDAIMKKRKEIMKTGKPGLAEFLGKETFYLESLRGEVRK